MIYLELDDLLAIASEVLGLEVDALLRVTDLGLADSAVARPQATFAGEEFYTTGGKTHEAPRFGHFPDAALLRDQRILVVDEVWETGETMAAVFDRIRAAGGRPISAVIHYKPGRSRVGLTPDHYAALADGWVTYPYKAGG